jgi:hypothetical protein
VLGVDHLVARPGVGLGQQREDLVGARAADDAGGVESVRAPDGRTQAGVARVRVDVEAAGGGAEGGDGPRARAERVLVGAELEGRDVARELRLATLVGGDVEDAGLRADGRVGRVHDGAGP